MRAALTKQKCAVFSILLLCNYCTYTLSTPIYQYVDSNGVITYTDKQLPGSKPFELNDEIIEHIENQVKLNTVKHAGGETLKIKNELYAPVEIQLTLENVDNVVGAANKKLHWILPPRKEIRLVTLTPFDRTKPMRYTPKLAYALGDPRTKPQPYRYPLPWRGGPFQQTQGPGGKFSHSGPKGRYARDIGMPEGTPIIAARSGIVIKVENNQTGQGTNPAGNFIRILHDDGTMSVYLHLKKGSIRHKEGQHVKVGDQIAFSGNTGRSTGPHLHFVVQRNVGMALESIPYDFAQPVNSKTIYRGRVTNN